MGLMEEPDSPDDFDHLPDSFRALRGNLERLLRIVPKTKKKAQVGRKPKHTRLKCVSPSGQRNILNGDKSPTLETLDKIAAELKSPGWLLVHPEMKEWDQERPQILFMIKAYLAADADGKDAMFRVARAIRKESAPV